MIKKFLLFFVVFLFAGWAPQAFAQGGFVPLAGIPGLTEGGAAAQANLASFFNNLYKFLIGIAATLAVIEIIWGGIEISTKDSVSQKQDGKARIYNAIFGLILVLSPVLIFTIINPSILNLSLSLPKIDLTFTPYNGIMPATLDPTDYETRSQWGTVLDTFSLQPNMSPRAKAEWLGTKQNECTTISDGQGVVLPQQGMSGGSYVYVCQTCPADYEPSLNSAGCAASGGCGTCRVKPAATTP